jgi:hypothetical protein
MIGSIPNPKKSIVIEKNISNIRDVLPIISIINSKYKKTNFDEILNLYTFEALEFLSLGVFIDINLNSQGETKTEVSVEIRRKVGSFDQSHEVTAANKHIQSVFESISKALQMSELEINQLKEKMATTPTNTKGSGCMLFIIVILIVSLIGVIS